MTTLYTRLRSNFEKDIFKFKESNYDFIRLHIGTNSVCIVVVLGLGILISFKADVLNWSYLKGLSNELSFFVGLFSIVFGMWFYNFWKLGERSVYTFHFAKSEYVSKEVNVLLTYKGFCFGVGKNIWTDMVEFNPTTRAIFCVGIFFCLALNTLDNGGFDKLKLFPSEVLKPNSNFCPDKEESIEDTTPKEGCELIIRAYKLGYAKDLGTCKPESIAPEKMEVCEKRRADEPYFHYMSRLLTDSVSGLIGFLNVSRVTKIEDKFRLQLKNLEDLRDYQVHAISASPRASHHIWTNLPYPENVLVRNYREIFRPNYCIEKYQNQTNTISIDDDDERKDGKLLEHVYGHLLFNPKSEITVGLCKEYKIHWESDVNICERLSKTPRMVLEEENILSEVELVLRRHDIANNILALDKQIKDIEIDDRNSKNLELGANGVGKLNPNDSNKMKTVKKEKNKIVTNKIAKEIQQVRGKNELVSFQCFMRSEETAGTITEMNVSFNDTEFVVRTRYFTLSDSKSESQISMYKEFSKVLEDKFHYSKLTSRSDIDIETQSGMIQDSNKLLDEQSYLFSRLEILKNVDIFLGNNWVLERKDLLTVYPYHVHLQNYVKSFRVEYHESRGRL